MPEIADKMEGIDFILDPYIRPIRKNNYAVSFAGENIGKGRIGADLLPKNVQKDTLYSEREDPRVKKNRGLKPYDDPKYAPIINQIQNDLVKKLNKGVFPEQAYNKIPWNKLKRDDLINWPKDVPLERITKQGKKSLEKINSNLERIDFSKDFLDRSRLSRTSFMNAELKDIREEISINLLIKLNEGLKTNFQVIPWGYIKRKDLVNWPDDVPVKKIFWLGKNHLQSLYESLDSINFTQDFFDSWASKPLARLKDVSLPTLKDPSLHSIDNQMIDGTERILSLLKENDGRQVLIDNINRHLLEKLNGAAGVQQKHIPWAKLVKGDLVNWPSSIRMVRPSQFGLSTLRRIHESLDSIYFNPAAVERLKISTI
jgi:hypothetical protein